MDTETVEEMNSERAASTASQVAFARGHCLAIEQAIRALESGFTIDDLYLWCEDAAPGGFASNEPPLTWVPEPRRRKYKPGMLVTYFIRAGANGPIKIGRSSSVFSRIMQIQTASPDRVEIVAMYYGDREKEFHNLLKENRISGEWFSPCLHIDVLIMDCDVDWDGFD